MKKRKTVPIFLHETVSFCFAGDFFVVFESSVDSDKRYKPRGTAFEFAACKTAGSGFVRTVDTDHLYLDNSALFIADL